MARLLLSTVRMKGWALLPLVVSSGCLFLDGLNRAPSVTVDATITSTIKGAAVAVIAHPTDAETPTGSLRVDFQVYDAQSGAAANPRCDYDETKVGPNLYVTFFRTGIFRVEAVATDPEGAPSGPASVMITVTDAPPQFADKTAVVQTSTPNACGANTAGDVVTLHLDGSVSDPDESVRRDDPSCPPAESLTYTWRISDQPAGAKPVLTFDNGGGCLPPTAASGNALAVSAPTAQVCLWTDPTLVGASMTYRVVLDVSDGTSTVTSSAGEVTVDSDEPPCITGSDPVAGSYVVDRSQLQQFDVDGVIDDRDTFGVDISYAWSVWREADPVWRPVPSWTLSTYQLDMSSFGVGENVRVRVEAIDRTGWLAPPSSCPVDADDCVVYSCVSRPNLCHKWKTWDLELR